MVDVCDNPIVCAISSHFFLLKQDSHHLGFWALVQEVGVLDCDVA